MCFLIIIILGGGCLEYLKNRFWQNSFVLQIEPYDVGISPEMEQQVANLLQSLEIQPVPQVKYCYSTPKLTPRNFTLLSAHVQLTVIDLQVWCAFLVALRILYVYLFSSKPCVEIIVVSIHNTVYTIFEMEKYPRSLENIASSLWLTCSCCLLHAII